MIITDDYNIFNEQYKYKSKDELIGILFRYTHNIVDLKDELFYQTLKIKQYNKTIAYIENTTKTFIKRYYNFKDRKFRHIMEEYLQMLEEGK